MRTLALAAVAAIAATTVITPNAVAYSTLGNSSARPALTRFNAEFLYAFKGAGGDTRIFVGNAGKWDSKPATGFTDTGPAITTWGSRVALAWKGVGDSNLWVSTSGDTTIWTPPVAIPGAATPNVPTLAVVDNILYAAWRGHDSGLYMSWTSNGTHWAPVQHAVPDGGSGDAPALTATSKGLVMAWRGLGSDPRFFYSRYANNHWTPQQQAAPGSKALSPPGLAPAYGNHTGPGSGLRLAWRESEFRLMSSYMEENGTWRAPVPIPGATEAITRSAFGPNIMPWNSGGDPRPTIIGFRDHLSERVIDDFQVIPR